VYFFVFVQVGEGRTRNRSSYLLLISTFKKRLIWFFYSS